MKYLQNLLLIFTLFLISCNSKDIKTEKTTNTEENTVVFDSITAKKYGADDYGMKKYVVAFLKKGPNRDLDKEEASKLQMAHMKNIKKMAKEGTLVLAGPFLGNGELRGIYVFDVTSIEEAEKLTASDPAIQAGSLEMELKEWYGSAALVGVSDVHEKISKIKF